MPQLRARSILTILGLTALSLTAGLSGCSQKDVQAEGTYFERKIAPILSGSCSRSPTGSSCHITADERGNALGNLDVTSYDMLSKRRDLMTKYGPFGLPALLVKAIPPVQLQLTAWDGTTETITTAIPHAGGSLFDQSSAGFVSIQRWLERGGTENNAPAAPPNVKKEACVDRIGSDPLFDPNVDPPFPDYQQFVNEVNPFLVENCAGANCHGAPEGSFPLTCGTTPEQLRWNYFSASDYTATNSSLAELLRRPLDPAYGGTYHEGGVFFSSPDDPDYEQIEKWVLAKGAPTNVPTDPGFDLFAKRVQPMLVKKGCILVGCHSPPVFNGFKPRAGSGGLFGLSTSRDNYRIVLKQVALESADPNTGRLLRKNLELPPSGRGIRHRGGTLFAGKDPSQCDLVAAETGPLDQQDPYCVIVAWIAKERAERMKNLPPLSAIIYVRRPPAPGPDTIQDFEAYAPGADLRSIGAAQDAQDVITTSGGDQSLLGGCGLSAASADVRRPQVSWDGAKVAFAARGSATEPLKVYVMNADGSSCAAEPAVNAPPTDEDGNPVPTNGEMVHNFDPTFAPDGTLVFASTRGNIRKLAEFKGPMRSAADPAKLNANLYVLEGGKVRQLTFLLNQELQPGFKLNGQMIMTTEKRAPGFYQLAARRINLDGGDYHPLFGQRATVGHLQVTDPTQLLDGNKVGIFSDPGAVHQAGALMTFNRSLGPDTVSPVTEDYLEDPDAMNYPQPAFFQRSLTNLDPAATGRVGSGTQGAYRNPSVLPNGNILVSYAANVADLTAFNGNFDVVTVDSVTGARTPLAGLSDAATDEVWAVGVFGRYSRGVFKSSPMDPTGAAIMYTDPDRIDRAQLTYLDFPMITSLAFQATRSRRSVQSMGSFELWESLPPEGEKSLNEASAYITDDQYGKLYARRRRIGIVPLEKDGSTRVQIPAGIPVLVGVQAQLAQDNGPTMHHQREETQYYPGEWVTLSFRRELFNNFCGGCHGPTTGIETDVAAKPDLLSQASQAIAKSASPLDLVTPTPGSIEAPPYP